MQSSSMMDNNSTKVKSSDLELKDRMVSLNRVTKVTKVIRQTQTGIMLFLME